MHRARTRQHARASLAVACAHLGTCGRSRMHSIVHMMLTIMMYKLGGTVRCTPSASRGISKPTAGGWRGSTRAVPTVRVTSSDDVASSRPTMWHNMYMLAPVLPAITTLYMF